MEHEGEKRPSGRNDSATGGVFWNATVFDPEGSHDELPTAVGVVDDPVPAHDLLIKLQLTRPSHGFVRVISELCVEGATTFLVIPDQVLEFVRIRSASSADGVTIFDEVKGVGHEDYANEGTPGKKAAGRRPSRCFHNEWKAC